MAVLAFNTSSLELLVLVQCKCGRRSWISVFISEAKQLESKKVRNLVIWAHVIPWKFADRVGLFLSKLTKLWMNSALCPKNLYLVQVTM